MSFAQLMSDSTSDSGDVDSMSFLASQQLV